MGRIGRFKEWLIDWDAGRTDFLKCPIFTNTIIPKPFVQKGWLWNHIPLFFWIVGMIFYSIIFATVITFEIVLIIIALLLFGIGWLIIIIAKYAIWPLMQIIGISLIHPDGTAIDKIKEVCKDKDNKKSDYSKPFTSHYSGSMTNATSSVDFPLPHDNIIEKRSMSENLTSNQIIEKIKDIASTNQNNRINNHTFLDNLQDKKNNEPLY